MKTIQRTQLRMKIKEDNLNKLKMQIAWNKKIYT
jgi:hypothetical protein